MDKAFNVATRSIGTTAMQPARPVRLHGQGAASVLIELARMAATAETIDEQCRSLLLFGDDDKVLGVRAELDWFRGGNETYILPFSLEIQGGSTIFLLFKACVAYSSRHKSVEHVHEDWLDRRRAVAAAGISTPRLFGIGAAITLEQFVEYDLRSRILNNLDKSSLLVCSAAWTLGALHAIGFRPVSGILDDIRTDGIKIFLTDFGSDLGAISSTSDPDFIEILSSIRVWLSDIGVPTPPNIDHWLECGLLQRPVDDEGRLS